ncbi:MAG: hypothetical protein KC474_03535 [Cyanobacteria bacterium HKST-UBA04]|nr:hypothetical protein [Cyanobacteria bacterium HKST-UBA04]
MFFFWKKKKKPDPQAGKPVPSDLPDSQAEVLHRHGKLLAALGEPALSDSDRHADDETLDLLYPFSANSSATEPKEADVHHVIGITDDAVPASGDTALSVPEPVSPLGRPQLFGKTLATLRGLPETDVSQPASAGQEEDALGSVIRRQVHIMRGRHRLKDMTARIKVSRTLSQIKDRLAVMDQAKLQAADEAEAGFGSAVRDDFETFLNTMAEQTPVPESGYKLRPEPDPDAAVRLPRKPRKPGLSASEFARLSESLFYGEQPVAPSFEDTGPIPVVQAHFNDPVADQAVMLIHPENLPAGGQKALTVSCFDLPCPIKPKPTVSLSLEPLHEAYGPFGVRPLGRLAAAHLAGSVDHAMPISATAVTVSHLQPSVVTVTESLPLPVVVPVTQVLGSTLADSGIHVLGPSTPARLPDQSGSVLHPLATDLAVDPVSVISLSEGLVPSSGPDSALAPVVLGMTDANQAGSLMPAAVSVVEPLEKSSALPEVIVSWVTPPAEALPVEELAPCRVVSLLELPATPADVADVTVLEPSATESGDEAQADRAMLSLLSHFDKTVSSAMHSVEALVDQTTEQTVLALTGTDAAAVMGSAQVVGMESLRMSHLDEAAVVSWLDFAASHREASRDVADQQTELVSDDSAGSLAGNNVIPITAALSYGAGDVTTSARVVSEAPVSPATPTVLDLQSHLARRSGREDLDASPSLPEPSVAHWLEIPVENPAAAEQDDRERATAVVSIPMAATQPALFETVSIIEGIGMPGSAGLSTSVPVPIGLMADAIAPSTVLPTVLPESVPVALEATMQQSFTAFDQPEKTSLPRPWQVSPDVPAKAMAPVADYKAIFNQVVEAVMAHTTDNTTDTTGDDLAHDPVIDPCDDVSVAAMQVDLDFDVELALNMGVGLDEVIETYTAATHTPTSDRVAPQPKQPFWAGLFSPQDGIEVLNGLQNPAANLSLLLVQFKGTVALVVDNGRKTTLVKTFADNPLSQNPRFGCQGTAVVGKRTMITAQVGAWEGIIYAEGDKAWVQVEL